MAIPFIKDEVEGTREIAFWACVGITFGLALVSLYGVWAEDSGPLTPGIFVGKLFWSIAVVGAEFLASMALQRAILAQTRLRKAGGAIVFAALAWFCVGNVERGVHCMYPEVFKSDTQELRDLANLAGTQASDIKVAATTAISSIPEQLASARTEIAKLEAELRTISAADGTETSIKLAQQHLQGLGLYDGNIDGVWQDKTKSAVLRRGAQIRTDLELKKGVISQLESGAPVTTTATASEGQNKSKIENDAKARKREQFGFQVITGAWTLEGARSLGWIVFISGITVAGVSALAKMREEIERQKLQNELDALRKPEAPVVEPVADPVATPEPAAEQSAPAAVEPTDAQRWGREGGKTAALNREAEKARKAQVFVIGPVSTLDVMKVAAE